MTKKTTLVLPLIALGPVFLAPAAAFANNPPAPTSMLAEILMFIVLIGLTAAGGGYAVLQKKQPGKRWTKWAGYTFLTLVLVFLSGATEGMMAMIVLIVAIWGILRGATMITWGVQVRSGKQRPEYLAGAVPWRLIAAGALLIVLMVTLAAAAFTLNMSNHPYRRRAVAGALNADAKNAYMYLKAYEAGNPRATGVVSCADLEKFGFKPSYNDRCSSDIRSRSGKLISGSIRMTWTVKPGLTTPDVTNPEAVMTYTGELTEARP